VLFSKRRGKTSKTSLSVMSFVDRSLELGDDSSATIQAAGLGVPNIEAQSVSAAGPIAKAHIAAAAAAKQNMSSTENKSKSSKSRSESKSKSTDGDVDDTATDNKNSSTDDTSNTDDKSESPKDMVIDISTAAAASASSSSSSSSASSSSSTATSTATTATATATAKSSSDDNTPSTTESSSSATSAKIDSAKTKVRGSRKPGATAASPAQNTKDAPSAAAVDTSASASASAGDSKSKTPTATSSAAVATDTASSVDRKTALESATPTTMYPPFQQPPQIAYGWFVPHPPPYGPYFWPCLPPGYALVPATVVEDPTAEMKNMQMMAAPANPAAASGVDLGSPAVVVASDTPGRKRARVGASSASDETTEQSRKARKLAEGDDAANRLTLSIPTEESGGFSISTSIVGEQNQKRL
jgi:hypothetical protein